MNMKNILVAVDFDEGTPKLVSYAKMIGAAFGAKLWLIHIAEEEPEFMGYQEGPQYIRDGFAEHLREQHRNLQSICSELRTYGIDCEGLMIQGPTVKMLLEESKKLHVDMIITCTHRRSFIYKAFFGSVSTDLFEEANIPVMAIPAH
jgi:nucleotide-binding universal stress UspA family protein